MNNKDFQEYINKIAQASDFDVNGTELYQFGSLVVLAPTFADALRCKDLLDDGLTVDEAQDDSGTLVL